MVARTIFIVGFLLLLLTLSGGQAQAQAGQATVGGVSVTLIGPGGLTRVDGLNSQVDAFIQKVAPKFKMVVLAVYAEPKAWQKFVEATSAGRPAATPRLAVICTTEKMGKKSYNGASLRREFKRYSEWFSLAANNRPMAAILTSQANKKLKEKIGVDLGFVFSTGEVTKKLFDGSSSIGFGAQIGFDIFGGRSDNYLTATALAVGDKLVFLGYLDALGSPVQQGETQAATMDWRDLMASANAAQYFKN